MIIKLRKVIESYGLIVFLLLAPACSASVVPKSVVPKSVVPKSVASNSIDPTSREVANSSISNEVLRVDDVLSFFSNSDEWKICDSQNQTFGSFLSRFVISSSKDYKRKKDQAGKVAKFVVNGAHFEWRQNNSKKGSFSNRTSTFDGVILVRRDRDKNAKATFKFGKNKFVLAGSTVNGLFVSGPSGAYEIVPVSAKCSSSI